MNEYIAAIIPNRARVKKEEEEEEEEKYRNDLALRRIIVGER